MALFRSPCGPVKGGAPGRFHKRSPEVLNPETRVKLFDIPLISESYVPEIKTTLLRGGLTSIATHAELIVFPAYIRLDMLDFNSLFLDSQLHNSEGAHVQVGNEY